MSSTGGRTNIFGVLFQILAAVEWAMTIALELVGEGDDEEIRITSEPATGGDIEIRWPHTRVVQQMKTRQTGELWRLRDAIAKAFPDLYLSVDRDRPGAVRHELVLDSPQSDWSVFEAFLRHVATNPAPARPSESLDDTVTVPFFPKESLTYREMFIHIRDTVRQREEVRDEPLDETERNLWHLLANFYVVVTPSGASQREALLPLLARYGYAGAEAEEKIDALAGAVLRRSTGDEAPFSPSELLAEAGITGAPVSDLTKLRHAARMILERDLRRRTTYSAAADVRRTSGRPLEKRTGALVGESGGGKTWDLARRAVTASESGPVTFRTASSDPERDVRNAIETIVRDVLGWKVDRTIDDLIAALRATFGTLPDPWLTICLDNVGIAEVDGLLAQPLADWGVRVLFAAPRVYQDALQARDIEIADVPNFSAAEVKAFLAVHDCDPDAVPREIRDTLQLPLLAWTYVTVAGGDGEFRPTSEYLLYDRYWRRLRTAGVQAKYPGDEERVVTLARSFRAGGAYPWPVPALDAAGVDDDVRHRLESIGWLTRDEQGNARIWHDRFLNWAVAESVARDFRDERLSVEDAAALLAQAAHVPWTPSEQPLLGYVPLDVLWILASRQWVTDETLSRLVEALEAPEAMGHDVYRLLTSIGPAIGPAVALRAHRIDADSSWLSSDLVSALLQIHDTEPDRLDDVIDSFLRVESLQQQVIGFMLGARRPAGRHLPRLWKLRLELHARFAAMRYRQGEDHAAHRDRTALLNAIERMFDALRHCARAEPEWVERHAASLATDDAGATAALIVAIADSKGPVVWRQTKEKLKGDSAPDHVRQLIDCVRVFRDTEERALIDEALRGTDTTTQAAALGALVHLDPDAAVEFLSTLDAEELAMARRWWLPWLAMLRPGELAAQLAGRVKAAPADAFAISAIYREFAVLLPPDVGDALLDRLAEKLEKTDRRRLFALSDWVDLLAAAPDLDLRAAIRARAGSPLETRLMTICSSEDDDYQLHDVYSAARLLRRIEGNGYRELMQAVVTPDAPHARVDLARFCPDDKLAEPLKMRIDRARNDPKAATVMLQSARLLAQAGGRKAIVEMVAKHGYAIVGTDVPHLIEGDEPLSDAELEPFLGALQETDDASREKAVAVLGLSGRRDKRDVVIATARAAAPASELRHTALLALRNLTVKGDEVPADLVGAEAWVRTEWKVVDLLHRSGTEASMDLLEQFLDAGPQENLRIDDERSRLLSPSERGLRTARRIWTNWRRWPADWWHRRWLRIAEFLDEPEPREWFREYAFEPGPNAPAIAWHLRHYDPSHAWRAAVAAFASGHDGAVEVMMALDEERAVDHLAAAIPDVRPSALRWEIGRQFRIAAKRERVMAAVAALIASEETKRRVAGYELAGWADWSAADDAIEAGAIGGGSFAVVQAAADAFLRRRSWTAGRQTLASLREASGLRAWNDCELLLGTVDALVLDEDRDELCIWPALRGKPLPVRRWVAAALDEAKKQLFKSAKDRDRDREWL